MNNYIKPSNKRLENTSDILIGDIKFAEECHLISELNRPKPYIYCPLMMTNKQEKY
ncbi:hypothetical protein bcgnr5390_59650 [Bacillus luti]|uniref:hypothetical protein n=1 Tax=Bacillus cereus group TaxID=86661 RepID=UPI0013C3159B|nr:MULTISPECIES: hypothetical protein [Bacillus cereus group]